MSGATATAPPPPPPPPGLYLGDEPPAKLDTLWGDWDPRLPISAYHYRKVQQKNPSQTAGVPAGSYWQSHSQSGSEPPPPPPPPSATQDHQSRPQQAGVDGLGDRGHTVTAVYAVPASDSTSSRRHRRDGGSRPVTATAVPAVRAAASSQAAWNKRGRRLRALLLDEHAGVAELKRELPALLHSPRGWRRLLSAAPDSP